MNAILGTEISASEMADILRGLDMKAEISADGKTLAVTPPHVRIDLKEEIDFSEEIARMYGYDKLTGALHRDDAEATASGSWRLRSLVRTTLAGMGYSEIQTYSFVSPKGADKMMLPEGSDERRFVNLINPLGEENSVMRTMLLPNMLDILAGNYSRGNATARLFEIGNTFRKASSGLPDEKLSLSIGFYGGGDFYDLKGATQALFTRLGIFGVSYVTDPGTGLWHPGRCARVELPGEILGSGGAGERIAIGHIGETHPDVVQKYDIGVPVFAAEFDFEAIARASDMTREYVPLRRYPAVTLDVALLAGEDVAVADIESVVRANGGDLLESVKLFDVYRGKQIAEGQKSLAFNLVYRAEDRTLTDGEVGEIHARILKEIAKATGAALREV
jgi:phenylalanyl-tRNA synthetase beta chain